MAEQIRAAVPSLSGGISKQPAHVRFSGQVEDATNADFSVADGCSKRAGTRLIKKLTGFTAAGGYRIHAINRDNAEQYLVVYGYFSGAMNIKVFHIDGTEATVTPTAAALAYLALNTPTVDQIRMATIADTTFIVNSTVETGSLPSAEYSSSANYRDDVVMFSNQPASGTYAKTSRDTLTYPKGYWLYTATQGLCGGARTVAVATSTWGTHNNASGYQAAANNPGGLKVGSVELAIAVTAATWTQATLTLSKAGSPWTSILFQVVPGVSQIYMTSGTNIVPGWYTIATMAAGSIVLQTSCTGGAAGGSNCVSPGIGREYEINVNFTGATITDMYDIAAVFEDAFRAAGCSNGLVFWTSTGTTSGYFTVINGYTGIGSTILGFSAPSSGYNYSQAGSAFRFSASIAGTGTANTQSPDPGSKWSRVPAPAQTSAQPDPSKMPIRMIRTAVGPPATFTIDVTPWNKRLSGDEGSNPVPELISEERTINDVAFFEDRLTFVGDEKILFTANGDFLELYKFNANNIVDSDPIQRSLSTNEVTTIDFCTPFRDVLVLFTRSGRQFELSSRGAFTPSTVKIDIGTSYNTVQAVRPRVSNAMLHFVAVRERETILVESRYSVESAATAANETTAHVERLLPTDIQTIAASPNNSTVVLMAASGQTLYAYDYFVIGDQKRQSAWTKYTVDASYRLADIAAIRNQLYMIVESQSQFVLESLSLSRPADDTGVGYSARLDRAVSLLGVYVNPTTTWTLPGGLSDTTITRAVLATGTLTGAAGDEITVTNAGTTVTKTGNYGGASAIIGRPFTMSVELTRPFRKDQNDRADIEAWVQHREIITAHKDTGSYTLRGTMTNRVDRTKTFAPASGILSSAGTMKSRFNGRADGMRVFIENATAKPCTIASIQYLLDYVPRT